MPVREFNDNIRVLAPKPVDERYGPHLSLQAALSFIPPFQRFSGLTVGIREFGNPNDPIVDYWWKDGLLDNQLIVKEPTINKLHHIHVQTIPADIWNVVHGLNKRPLVRTELLNGDEIIAEIKDIDNNRLQVLFDIPFAGRAYCT